VWALCSGQRLSIFSLEACHSCHPPHLFQGSSIAAYWQQRPPLWPGGGCPERTARPPPRRPAGLCRCAPAAGSGHKGMRRHPRHRRIAGIRQGSAHLQHVAKVQTPQRMWQRRKQRWVAQIDHHYLITLFARHTPPVCSRPGWFCGTSGRTVAFDVCFALATVRLCIEHLAARQGVIDTRSSCSS